MICSVFYLFNSKTIHINCAISKYLKGDDYQEHSRKCKLYSLIIFYYKLLVCQVHQSGWVNAKECAVHYSIDRNI